MEQKTGLRVHAEDLTTMFPRFSVPLLPKPHDLESKLTRHGYNVKTLAEAVNVQPKVIRSFLRKKLSPGQTQEIKVEMLAVGIPL